MVALAALGKREGCFKKRLASLPVFTLAFLFFSFLLLPFSPRRGSILPFRMLWSEP